MRETQRVLVVKVGGAEGVDVDAICSDVAEYRADGAQLVLVHGGSALTNRLATALGRPPRFIVSPSGHRSRFTDRAALEVLTMACAGAINAGIVERLQRRGVAAVGLAGLDGRLLEGRHKRSVRSVEGGTVRRIHGDHTGTVERVNVHLLRMLLGGGYLPVVTLPAISEEGIAINVDADRAAAAIAAALGADDLVILSNVPGLLTDVDDAGSRVERLARTALDGAIGRVGGGMKKKLLAAAEALAAGVERVIVADGRVAHPLADALAGRGTVIA